MEAVFGWLFNGAWQWVLGKFGQSDAQKLGRSEVITKNQAQTIQELNDGKAIETAVLSEPTGAANEWLHNHKPKR